MTTILDEVKGLTVTGSEVEVGTVLIESTAYNVFLKKIDSTATPANPAIDKTNHKITVEVKDTPADANGINTAIATIKVGGTVSAPVYDATGKDLNCSSGFDTATAPVTCTQVTGLTPDPAKTILEQVQGLTDGNSLAIATEKINGDDYAIKVAKIASGTEGSTIDIGTKTITISKVDWSSSTSDTLKAAIAAVKIGGTSTAPTIDLTNGKAIDCSGLAFDSITAPGQCAEITLPTPTSKTILEQVQALNVGDAALAIATEKINGVDYTIKAAKLATGGAESTVIDNTAKTITISKVDWSTDTANSAALQSAISAVKIGGTVDKLAIDDSKGTPTMCYADFTKIADAASANCDSILFASKGYTDVATSILKDNAKITSTDNLKTLIKAVLKVEATNDLKAASIVSKIIASKANDDINNAAKALCSSADLTKISADDFKNCVATALKGYVTMNKILTNLPNQAAGVLKSDDDGTKFVDFESGLKDAAFASGQFYFDFTTPICVARPFISGVEIPSVDVGTCLNQVNTAAYVLLRADAKCGSANKGDLTDCYKAIADSGLKALYTATPDALLVDFSANYPDVLDN